MGKKIFKSVAYVYFVIITSISLLCVLLGSVELHSSNDLIVAASFITIGVVSAYLLTTSVLSYGISLSIIHWYFILIFFSIVPFVQYLGDLYRYNPDSETIIIANGYILLWCLLYWFSYKYATKADRVPKCVLSFLSAKSLTAIKIKMYVLIFIAILSAASLVSLAGTEVFYTRAARYMLIEQLGGWGPLSLIATYYVKPMIFYVFIVFCGVLIYKQIKGTGILYFWLIVLFFINLLVNNPLSGARFYAFTLLFGICVLILYRYPRPSLVYVSILAIGLPLFAIVNQFRYITSFRGAKLQFNWHFMLGGDFDAYENFIHTINYVAGNGIVYGRQLLGGLLFFVPRSVWVDKPVGSGAFIAEFLGSKFNVANFNISNPLISEMFLNFHVVGIIVGSILYGTITGWMDKRYWVSFEQYGTWSSGAERKLDFYRLLYPFLLGLYLFHLRGDFMSSFAYMTGFVLAFLTVVAIVKFHISKV